MLGWWLAVLGAGGRLQPIPGPRGRRHPMVAAGGHHEQHIPPMQLNGVQAHLPRLPRAVLACTRT